ncbi:MAG: bifunctional phosphoribosyl-AMP cyclohydrolase/phosphoribosyl-ATP diphosphatase HisIE [Eubacteriales bacterium]|nr:bifunctional phosphoribosyl-AMP cyclohydrolase/phosphoribosyl-ATP diphosphatase HisIE [Eubacteriales bacterium]
MLSDIVDKAKFNDKGLMPVIIQDSKSKTVLMLAYMNRLALEKTIETGLTHFWSRSREKLWMKGETSGHIQRVVSMSLDCDCDTLLVNVEQTVAACHTGTFSCFSETVEADCCASDSANGGRIEILQKLYNIILDRKANPKEGSYTKYLFEKGLDKILKKVGEESAEVIIAAKNQNADEIIYEVSDLVYHVMVLLAEREVSPEAIYQELEKRFKP